MTLVHHPPEIPTYKGDPIIRDDGAHLAYNNYAQNTIHYVSTQPDAVGEATAICTYSYVGNLSDKQECFYVHEDDLTDSHLMDNGEKIAKICGHCANRIKDNRQLVR